jgi:hypothetical protein
MLTGVLCNLYEGLVNFKLVGVAAVLYVGTYSVFLKVTFHCHTDKNKARTLRSLVEKLLLEGKC